MFKELFTEISETKEPANMKTHVEIFTKTWKKLSDNRKGKIAVDWEKYKKDIYNTGIITIDELKKWGNPFKEK